MSVSRQTVRVAYAALESPVCISCQWRSFSTSYRLRVSQEKTPSTATTATQAAPAPAPSPLADAPRAYGKAVSDFTPKPLPRPIGLLKPPRAGENSGLDLRTWKQKRDDFVDHDKHLAKRKILTKKMSTPYFREWSNMRHHKGKSFLAPQRLFKADKALYFPNLHGQTLTKSNIADDTTDILTGKVSIVSVFSSEWGQKQAASFVAEEQNPELHNVIRSSGGLAQIVRVNLEENALKAMLINLFLGNLRRKIGEENWGKYFIVRRGLTDEIKEAIGLLNTYVGYTYLLDGDCKIRWAGSGVSEEDEKQGLIRGTRKLVDEVRSLEASQTRAFEEVEAEPEEKAAAAATV